MGKMVIIAAFDHLYMKGVSGVGFVEILYRFMLLALSDSHSSPVNINAYSPIVMPYTIGTGCMPTKLLNDLSSTGPST